MLFWNSDTAGTPLLRVLHTAESSPSLDHRSELSTQEPQQLGTELIDKIQILRLDHFIYGTKIPSSLSWASVAV